jgi:required for meiotic nuclear division protein 1
MTARTLLPPLPPRLLLEAESFEGLIDLRAFAAANPQLPVLSRNPLVVRLDDSLFYLARFGVVVAWNASQDQLRAFHARLQATPGVGPRVEPAGDRLTVYADAAQDQAGFNEVWIKDLTLEKLTVISLALAKSVALDRFEAEVSAAMAKTQPLLSSLRTEGRIRLGHREVLKIIGFAMDVGASVLNSLTLFEDPPEAWEDEALDRLHRALSEQFDLLRRGEAINRKLAYVTDAGQILMDLLSTRKAHQLEWIVIVLIFIETVFFVGHEGLLR